MSDIEHFLMNYFNEVRFVDGDSIIDDIISITKENGVVKKNIEKRIFNLQSLLTPSLEGINGLLYLEFNKCESVYIKRNLLQRILGFNEININSDEWVITSAYNYKRFFSNKEVSVYISDHFNDMIIVGNTSLDVIINKDLSSFYIDYSKFKVYKTKKSR